MLTFIKLGGSLITDKRTANTFRPEVAGRITREIAGALAHPRAPRLLIGHGSGSFGHVAAREYDTLNGVRTPAQWRGYASVAAAALHLNRLMGAVLEAENIPILRLQPSASALSHDGRLIDLALAPIRSALEHGLVPLVHGDVSMDEVRGGTIISTEALFFYLAQHLPVQQILLLTEVDGVYNAAGRVIPSITPQSLPEIEAALGGASGTDVTGGMETKVRDMVALVERLPALEIRIMNGMTPGLLLEALAGTAQPGTRIHAR